MFDVQGNLDRIARELALERKCRTLEEKFHLAQRDYVAARDNLLDQIDWQDKKLEELSKWLQALAHQSEELMNDRYRYNAQLVENKLIKKALENEESLVRSLSTKCSELRADNAGLIEDSLRDTSIINDQWSALHNVEQHWLFFFLPGQIRNQVRRCLGNPDALR